MDKIKIAMDVSKAMADLNKYVTNSIKSSKTNNSKPVESIDLEEVSSDTEVSQTDISSNQVNVSDIANSYNIDTTDLQTYQASLEKELELYQVMLEDTENELGILKEDAFAESGTNLSVIEDMCKDYENTITSEIYQLIEQYKISCPEEKLEKFGINQADVTSMSYAELFEILKEKDDDVKEKLASIEEYKKENLDKAISENTEFSTYDEYLKRIEELESQQVTLNSAIYKTEQLKKMAKYEFLVKEEDYQNFNYECQIDKSVIEEMRMQMGTQVSYSEYCSKTGDNISPLEFCIWVRDNYPDTTATAMDNEALLKTLISVADEDSDLIKTYNYLFEKEGIESANKYLEDIEDQINQLAGQKKAEEFLAGLEKDENGNYNYEDIMNHFKVTGKGLGDGAQSFFLGLAAWHQSSDVYSVEEYESLYILEALSGDKEFANFLDNNYEISMSVGNMLPSMAAGMLLTPAAGTFLMGASAGGNSYHQALVNGASIRDAVFYGVLSGTSEATLEKYLGAIPGLSDIKVSSLKDLGKSVLKEGTEEWTQEYVDAALRGTVLGEQIEGNQLNGDALKSFIYGAIIGGIMNSPSAISGEVSNRTGSSNIESNITNTVNEDVSNLTSEVKDSISAINSSVIQESVSKSIAEKISKSIKSLNIPGLSAIKKITEGSKNIALSTSNAINIESVIDNVTSAGIDNIEFLESDIKALMANSTFENQTDLWDVTRIRDNFTKILRGKIDLNIVNKVIDNVNIIDASYWQQFLKTNGYNSNLVGFVNHTGNVFFPSNANMHMVMHELFHKFSELRELYSTDIYGNKRKVTGIREYYSDGRESSFANEALTEYLSSKYYDKKIYNYMYGVEGTRLWERVDNAISSKYGDDFLLDCYLNNNTNALREIFNQYVYQGAYDDFVLAMGSDSDHVYIYKNLDSLKDIVSKLEKSMGPKGIKGIIQSIFGSKSNKTNNTNRIENVSSNINNTQAYNTINNIFIELSRGVGSKEYASTALENYMYTGNKSEIASISPQIASMLDSVSKDEIDNYLLANHTQIQYQYRRLQDFVKTMDSKKYNGYGMKALEEYITYDNLNAITRTDNIRDKIKYIPKNIIQSFITSNNNLKQNVTKVANGVDAGIHLQNNSYMNTNQNSSNQFLESDIRALMASYTEEDDANIWDAKRVKNVFYKALKGKFKKSYIDSIVDDVNIIDANEWVSFLAKRGHESTVRGFVDKNHSVYFPSNASMHEVIHELFHKFSEFKDLKIKTSKGLEIKASGIIEFYSDDTNNILSNECLTDYLASKYYDQKIYYYNYDDVGIRLWERIDNALYELYGENDILLDSYLNNDPDTIRSIFDRYVYDGAYTELSKELGRLFGNSKITGLVSQFEKAINPMGIKERVHSIFNNTSSNKQREKIDNDIKEVSHNKENEESGSFIFMNPRTSRYLDNLFNEMSENCGKENAIKYLEDYIKTGDKEELAASTFILFKKLDALNTADIKRYLLMKGYTSEENYDRLLVGRRKSSDLKKNK